MSSGSVEMSKKMKLCLISIVLLLLIVIRVVAAEYDGGKKSSLARGRSYE
jgi:hypothetical protein